MKITTKSQAITEFAMSYGQCVASDIETKHLHIVKSQQNTWQEKDLFKKVNAFNERIDSKNWQDIWK